MPYLLLAIGLLIGLYALYRFLLKADVRQIKALFLSAIIIVLCLALFFMAITGRLPAALALLVAIWPFVIGLQKVRKEKDAHAPESEGPMTREDALEVLGLEAGASKEDIKEASKKLLLKVHPGQEGSDWLASKLNQARDILLNKDE